MKNDNLLKVEGLVKECLPGLLFRVVLETENGEKEVLAHLGGKMKLNKIRVLPGDRVILEMTNINDRRGRIVKRL
jgi:translation initiation factor IF-1